MHLFRRLPGPSAIATASSPHAPEGLPDAARKNQLSRDSFPCSKDHNGTLPLRSMQSGSPDANPSSRRRQRLSSSPSDSSANVKRLRLTDLPVGDMATTEVEGKLLKKMAPPPKPVFHPFAGVKKLVIKNLRQPVNRQSQVEEYYTRVEEDLGQALEAICAGRRPALPLERLYRGVEDVCRRGNAAKVYRLLKEHIDAHLHKTVLPRIKRNSAQSNIDMVQSVKNEWKLWNAQAITIRSTFSFLDRTYLLRESLPSINDMILSYFRRIAFSRSQANTEPFGEKVIAGVCELIEHDRRDDGRLDSLLLKEAIRMLYVLGVYVKYFEPAFLRQSNAYFREFGEACSISSLRDYILAVKTLLDKEEHRCIAYNFDSTTEKQLMDSAHDILIDSYSEKLLNGDSLSGLLSDKDIKSMKGLYDLLCLSDIQKTLKNPWGDYIQSTGAAIIADKKKGEEMVIRLLELRRSLDLTIRDAFRNDEVFLWSMRDSFGRFMNDRKTASCWDSGTSKIGEMIAKYVDALLRGGLRSLPKEMFSDAKDRAAAEKEGQASTGDEDAELDRQLDQALELFRFIEGKDAFEAFYKKDLARRLLMGRSASKDAERNMLTKLRSECGSNFTHNLEQMFKDQEVARDEMDAYREWDNANLECKPPVDLTVMILSASAWPSYPDVRMNLPDEVATQIERFDKHYKGKHTGRKLAWKHGLAHCSMKAVFPKGAKELLVSSFQAVVLMMFNLNPPGGFYTYEQISSTTGLQGSDLDRTLQSLACGKFRVITKHPKGREVNRTDTFTFNESFHDAKMRVKINQIQLKETKEENKATHERIAQDRRFETQAAIVRIMKSRKSMRHAELVAEVINLTKRRGSVEPAAIKKEIERYVFASACETLKRLVPKQNGGGYANCFFLVPCSGSLIEKDYLEREDNLYTYLA
ncbi:hypothetical protein QQS21_008952 [Conoideocrella luteorostrata]|uniref:Cullin family profile domain-containing protein n=1 Tax=Conoideocrella luteorostrata TaxID=1105319 RepID=A0AAJ0CIQ8_9HYPO|nr:hypothetical protein QQS21_008952 [Conoideocrella luteorostrata]